MDLGFEGKVVLVTGGAGRIGPVICATFAREGAAVAVLDIAADRAQHTAHTLQKAGARAMALGADVSRADEVQRALGQAGCGWLLRVVMTPLRRTGAPADIAEVVAFVASDRAPWLTGSIIEVSGGSHTGRPHVPLPRPPE